MIFYSHSCNSGAGKTSGSLVNGFRNANARAFIGTNRKVSCGGASEDITVTKCIMKNSLIRNESFASAESRCLSYGAPTFLAIHTYGKDWDNIKVIPPTLKDEL